MKNFKSFLVFLVVFISLYSNFLSQSEYIIGEREKSSMYNPFRQYSTPYLIDYTEEHFWASSKNISWAISDIRSWAFAVNNVNFQRQNSELIDANSRHGASYNLVQTKSRSGDTYTPISVQSVQNDIAFDMQIDLNWDPFTTLGINRNVMNVLNIDPDTVHSMTLNETLIEIIDTDNNTVTVNNLSSAYHYRMTHSGNATYDFQNGFAVYRSDLSAGSSGFIGDRFHLYLEGDYPSYMEGSLGIFTKTPDEAFEIEWSANVDVEIGRGTTDTDVTFLTLRSPNGTKYYITVDDSGNFVSSVTKP